MKKACFLDRDGTIIIDKGYLKDEKLIEFIPGVPDELRKIKKAGYLLIIVTNQSGVARGYFSEEDVLKINNIMCDRLKQEYGVEIDAVYYCPHFEKGIIPRYSIPCNCRKPKLGMFTQAIKDYDIDISCSYAIGDRMRDLSICENSNCKGYLVSNIEKEDIVNDIKSRKYENISYSASLYEAAKTIVGEK